MIPDDNPGSGRYMTLKDIRKVLTEDYGAEHDCPMPEHEIVQVITALRNGLGVTLCQAGMYIVPEGGPGLYCAYGRKVQDDE